MTPSPLVYAVVVAYNGMKWLNKCLESLYQSKYSVHVIVVDNGSTDGSVEFIKEKFPQTHVIESKQNLGFGKANNIGIKYGLVNGGDFFLLLNQDASIDKDSVKELLATFQSESKAGVVSPVQMEGSGTALDYGFEDYLKRYAANEDANLILSKQWQPKNIPAGFVNAAAWMVSRKCIETVGGFNPLFPHYGEDNDYINRMQYHGLKLFVRCNAFVCHDRVQHKNHMPLHKLKMREYVSFLKHFANVKNTVSMSVLHAMDKLFRETIYYLLHFEGRKVIAVMAGFGKAVANFSNIVNSRRESIQKGAYL
ncbi:glycosyltransferase family 2 protein [Fulvivirga kasyanovii]|uniref:Glycosyltransferase family 2 protein n=1 Tax=Fulvivirga kasyanovii TaxID=396812 RepID=A0ABW9RV26_9BACT|nr:glycosyltransferase family 2 protein [Fulvivirga kasyanovii]MTI28058.1 glycosyltransferase family 2 protein [Fulvivirga kasyanovii]